MVYAVNQYARDKATALRKFKAGIGIALMPRGYAIWEV